MCVYKNIAKNTAIGSCQPEGGGESLVEESCIGAASDSFL